MHLRTVRTVAALRAAVSAARRSGHTIGLVPTMGSLHDGHLSLMRAAAEQCGFVVMSLFVNPAQFGPGEDFERYPRDERRDAELAAACGRRPALRAAGRGGLSGGVLHLGARSPASRTCCAAHPASRGRSHFTGVATVVAKLLNMCAPDVAFFGQKDYQQSLVIRRLVRDLNIPVRIEVCPTVREPDGLALSSRNAYLDPEQRERAASLNRALGAAAQAAQDGAARAQVRGAALDVLARRRGRSRSTWRCCARTTSAPRGGSRASASWSRSPPRSGRARLIDNTLIELPSAGERPADEVALAGG